MNAIKRSIAFSMLKYLIKPGNVTIISADDFRVPPRKNNYQMHGYRIQSGSWTQNIVILAIDEDKPMGPSAISSVRNILSVMGFQVSPIMLVYTMNRGDCPECTPYNVLERT